MDRFARLALWGVSAIALALAWPRGAPHAVPHAPPQVSIEPASISADGYETATIAISPNAQDPAAAPRIEIVNNAHSASVEAAAAVAGGWRAQVRAGVTPARIVVRVEYPGELSATALLITTLNAGDRSEDGTPDFLRLDDLRDQQAFRRWFTYLAEVQYFQMPANRPAEINDCAALIRYAYREALRGHDSGWAAGAQLPLIPAFDSIAKYQYPFTPLGAALFRVVPGPFRALETGGLETGGAAFAQFADAQTLWRYNTHFVSRNVARALPGDLLFFRQPVGREPFHSMIYLGESQIRRDGRAYVLYHTGPDDDGPGEIRRLTVEELLRFPQPEWRPSAGNFSFLGVFRWNILRKDTGHDARRNQSMDY